MDGNGNSQKRANAYTYILNLAPGNYQIRLTGRHTEQYSVFFTNDFPLNLDVQNLLNPGLCVMIAGWRGQMLNNLPELVWSPLCQTKIICRWWMVFKKTFNTLTQHLSIKRAIKHSLDFGQGCHKTRKRAGQWGQMTRLKCG